MTFRQLEEMVGPLPPNARAARQWWANTAHTQADTWQSAGWIVDAVNFTAESVVFVRGRAQRRR